MPERRSPSAASTAPSTLCDLAAEHEVAAGFGIVSIHNQPLVDGLVGAERYVPVRHEATTVSAADAYSRITEGLGIAVTSTGTGAGNAAGSLIEALAAGSSVLHVTGNIDSAYLGLGRGVIHETKDQQAMLAAVSKHQHTVRSAEEVEPALRTAALQALTAPAGPVSVEIPIDLQYAVSPGQDRAPDPEPDATVDGDLDRAVALIDRASRPLLWAGGGSIAARETIEQLCRRLDIPVITSNAGRGVISEADPLVVGNFAATDGGQELLDRADLLISIGTHFRSNETRHYKLRLPPAHVQIDVDPAAIGRVYPCDVGLVGTAGAVVDGLLERLSDTARPSWVAEAASTRDAVRATLRRNIGPYAALCDAMRDVLPPEAPLVRDVTIPSSAWGNRLLDVLDPTTNINARGGGIGQGLGMAIGAAVGRPGVPTSLMAGDGGFVVHLGELATVAEQELAIVAIVFDDGGYGVLRNLQDAHFPRRSGVDLLGPDLATLASAFDLDHHRIADPAESRPVLDRATASGRPTIVEVDCSSFGEMPVPFVPPVPVS